MERNRDRPAGLTPWVAVAFASVLLLVMIIALFTVGGLSAAGLGTLFTVCLKIAYRS